MRQILSAQFQFGEIDIADINFDHRSRDDIPQILFGLQHLYTNKKTRERLFTLLEQVISSKVNQTTGRPGMHLWKIFVLGVLRLNLNWNYDRVREMANQHATIRQMLEHGQFDEADYKLQTIKDNVSLLTPELLEQINAVVVSEGHEAVGKKKKLR